MHDEKLILYYYDDGLSMEERSQIEAALTEDPALAARYKKLRNELSELSDVEIHPAPPDVVHRWHDSIDRAARMERNRYSTSGSSFNFMSFVWGAAVTAALAIGIGIGVYFSAGITVPPVVPDATVGTTSSPATTMTAAFTRGLQVHLRDSQREISRLPNYADADRALLLMDIIEQNRLFERTAEQKNSPKLARVLRAFEPILIRLAAEDLAPEDVEALRAQLAFELNVMLTKLAREASEEPHSI
jgi:hypothetical protein